MRPHTAPTAFALALLPLLGCGPDDTRVSPAPSSAGVGGLCASAVSPRNIRVVWQAEDSGFVRIERASLPGPFAQVSLKPIERGRFLDLALSPGTTYQYRVWRCARESACHSPVTLAPVTTPWSPIEGFHVEVAAQGTEDNIAIFGLETATPNSINEAHVVGVDRQGVIVWEYFREGESIGPATEVHLLPDGTLVSAMNSFFVHLDLDGTRIYRYEGNTAHHNIKSISGGRFIFLFFDVFSDAVGDPILGDGIEIIRYGDQFPLWSWRSRDHIPLADRDPIDWDEIVLGVGRDWTHANAVTFDEERSQIYFNVRNLNRIYCLSYPSGDILWTLGDGGDFGAGLFSHSHTPLFLSESRFLLFDNGLHRPGTTEEYSRIIEIEFDPVAKHAEIVWEYRESPDFFAFAQGSVALEPNGNIFVGDGINGRLFEITRGKKKVWQLRFPPQVWSYKAITAPRKVFEAW